MQVYRRDLVCINNLQLFGLKKKDYKQCQNLESAKQMKCQFIMNSSLGPKTGMVGEARFQSDAIPGTYWYEGEIEGEKIQVIFECQEGQKICEAKVGANLLKVAELNGAVKTNEGYCYEGTCETCVFECEGAKEVEQRASKEDDGFVRSCIAPIPKPAGPSQNVVVKVLSDEDVWGENML
eukprot:TRINITY_DN8466_c0_g1_i2.p2 TRINITY_DN8466_c0_g1~~TRINITY_DN8466_c0_g1_i2.p2  ORF type:complete len:180 (+),score=20.28 TRINITY_DN8466_c0_g1_i2:101-640(+)